MCNYRVFIVKDSEIKYHDSECFEFDDLQEALAKYDYEMKMDHNDCRFFRIRVQKLSVHGFFYSLIDFACEVEDLNVLLKSS